MYNAPAVNFPVGRSGVFGVVLGLLWAIGAVAAGFVASLQSQAPWVAHGVFVLCVACAAAAFIQWRKSPNGTLAWDRDHWSFVSVLSTSKIPLPLDDATVHLDFQLVMLVSFSSQTGRRLWIWLERANDQGRWRILRRAIFARPGDKVADQLGERSGRKALDNDGA
jgi:hypothetical protein